MNLDVGFLCNGLLSGLVSITACCDVSTPRFSMLIGLLAGAVIYPTTSNGMRRLRLDDPVDAVPVHAAAGLFGVLVVGVCMPDCAASCRKLDSHFGVGVVGSFGVFGRSSAELRRF